MDFLWMDLDMSFVGWDSIFFFFFLIVKTNKSVKLIVRLNLSKEQESREVFCAFHRWIYVENK